MLRYCRPPCVPALNLVGLPDYESTSDEEEAEEKQENANESKKYSESAQKAQTDVDKALQKEQLDET